LDRGLAGLSAVGAVPRAELPPGAVEFDPEHVTRTPQPLTAALYNRCRLVRGVLDHVLPDVPKGRKQMWQAVENTQEVLTKAARSKRITSESIS
jgi:hypothetical protein